LETWIFEGTCGAAREETLSSQLRSTTQRPHGTEDELGALVAATKNSGAQPHAMTLACRDHAILTPAGGELDYEALLGLVTRELSRVTSSILRTRGPSPGPDGRDLVVIYGGALHNDRFPYEGVNQWSYAAAIDALAADRYVEVDLYVPEYIRDQKTLAGEAWYGIMAEASDPETTVLIQRGPRSWIVLLPTSAS
jgi:hypothetical protein